MSSYKRLRVSASVTEFTQRVLERYKKFKPAFIDSGAYANVYSLGPKRVMKIVINDDGYARYLRWAARHQDNPWVPQIHSVEHYSVRYREMGTVGSIPYTDKVTVVIMERLRSAESHPNVWRICEVFEDGGIGGIPTSVKDALLPSLRKLCRMVRRHSCDTDIHAGNVMLRGKQFVLTDPFSS